MTDRILTLHQLCLRDIGPVDLVRTAAATGFGHVTVFVHPPAPQLDIFPRLLPQDSKSFCDALEAHQVQVHNIEALPFSGRTDPADYLPVLDQGAQIGARRATVLVYDRDLGRAADRLAVTCDHAGERGIAISIEFMAFSALQTIARAADFVRGTGHRNLSLLVDPLHLARTGGSPADLAAVADTIGALQFCDAMLAAPDDPFREAVEDREIPGQGQLPLQDFLDQTDSALPLDVEVPMLRLQHQGLDPIARATLLKLALSAYRL